MRDFKKLIIWQNGFQIAINTYKITETFSSHHKWTIGSQINRAAMSIPSNIAEGSGRASEKEYARFIEISQGSSFELETQLLMAKKLSIGNQELIDQTLILLIDEQKMMLSFKRSLQTKG